MAVILNDGTIADTGVAKEMATNQLIESPAHQRDCYPYPFAKSISYQFSYWSNYFQSTVPTSHCLMTPNWDIGVYWPNNFSLGVNDSRGYNRVSPKATPFSMNFGGPFLWSGDAANGQPYYDDTAVGGSGPSAPSYSYLCNFGDTAAYSDRTWYEAGTYNGTFNLQEQQFEGPGLLDGEGGMDNSFIATFNLGPITITGSIAAGFSGTGISSNAGPGTDIIRVWSANFSYTFTERWHFTASFGPLLVKNLTSFQVGNPPAGGGKMSIVISK